jgi:enamine deaminase RidA (YjgF/YER057c/UK114 family)
VKAVRSGALVFLAGQGPRVSDTQTSTGKLGTEADVASGQRAAAQIVLNSMATLKRMVGDLDRVSRIVRLLCFVNSDPCFTRLDEVADGASDLLLKMFGEARWGSLTFDGGNGDAPVRYLGRDRDGCRSQRLTSAGIQPAPSPETRCLPSDVRSAHSSIRRS